MKWFVVAVIVFIAGTFAVYAGYQVMMIWLAFGRKRRTPPEEVR